MEQKLIYKKGYHLEVTSWENDGDYERTKTTVVTDMEEAQAWKRMCDTLFKSGGKLGISNEWEEPLENFEEQINEFFDNDSYLKNIDPSERIEYVENVADELLGGSEEGYSARVSEKCDLFFVKEDFFVELV